MEHSLRKKTLKGVGWSFIDNILSSGITFLVGLVLARLLSPTEFGIIGMTTIFIALSNSIVDSGFSNALIRKTDASSKDYNTVFYFNLLISLLLYLILYFSSPAIAVFFKEPKLLLVLRVLGSILIISALAIVQRTLLTKRIDFKSQAQISLIASVSSGIIGIGMALMGFGVWSLVGQLITKQILYTCLLWFYSSWRPAWEYSKESFNELFGYGSKLLLSGLISTIYKNIYYLVIGRFYSASQLGQYTRAEQFNSIFASNLTSVVQRVSYPALSSIQNDPCRLKVAYRKVIKNTMMVSCACLLGLAAVAKPLIIILIGEKWLEAVSYLQIICFSGMLYPLQAINLNMLQVKGRSDLFLKLEIIKKVIATVPLLFGILYGIKLMLWGSVCTSIIAYFINSYYSGFLINYSTKEQLKDILPILTVSLITAFTMWSITFLNISLYLMLPIQCVIGVILAVLMYDKLKMVEYIEMKQMISSYIKSK